MLDSDFLKNFVDSHLQSFVKQNATHRYRHNVSSKDFLKNTEILSI
jgi:hypothetical protein